MIELMRRRRAHQGMDRRFLAQTAEIILHQEDRPGRHVFALVQRVGIVEHDLHRIGHTHRAARIRDIGAEQALIITDGFSPADAVDLGVIDFLQGHADGQGIFLGGGIAALQRVEDPEILGVIGQDLAGKADDIVAQGLQDGDRLRIHQAQDQAVSARAGRRAIALHIDRVGTGLRRRIGQGRVQRAVAPVITA